MKAHESECSTGLRGLPSPDLSAAGAFDSNHWMLDADVCAGQVLDVLIQKFLSNPAVDYLQAHFAKPGCYAARIDRV
jgi:Protein of unknown function (DUF1203)